MWTDEEDCESLWDIARSALDVDVNYSNGEDGISVREIDKRRKMLVHGNEQRQGVQLMEGRYKYRE